MRYFIGFVILAFALLIGLTVVFHGFGSSKPKSATPATMALPQYANTDATVSLTIGGAITGDDTYREIRITIGRNQRELQIIQGYSGNVISDNSTYNTTDAYNVFLHSLALSGFTTARKPKDGNFDSTGQCPFGNRYIYNLSQNGKNLTSLWSTNCGTEQGTFGGSPSSVIPLFQNQITNYQTLTQDVDLSDPDS
ncbi:MAG TPA: hypothetical protein VMT23_00935 [Candidatus Binatia bacterium]|nr:hypothetical protein [Candidatus Binatia bacterium]